MGITAQLAEFTAGISLDRLPPEVVNRARFLVLDLVGNIVRARHDAESTPSFVAAARAMGMAAGNSGVFGDAARYTPAGAAFLNGALAHSLDFDDTHAAGSLHPGAPVIPAALAAGEMVGASGADVLAAIVAGYEMTCRVALALPAGEHYDRGFHPTATCGAFGAAAAAARVFRLDAEGVAGALGTVLSQCAGSLQFLVNGAWTKRFQVGWAATNGLMAATLVREGFKGAAEALEGRHGFLRAYAPNPNPDRAVQDLGTVFELMATAVKPYPSCRYGHAGIDAALALRAANDLKPADIDRVTLGLPRAGMMLIGQPADKKANPENVVDGQFSGPVRDLGGAGDRGDGLGQLQSPARSPAARAATEGDLRIRSRDRGRVPGQHVGKTHHRGSGPAVHPEGGGAEGRALELPQRGGAAREVRRADRCGARRRTRGTVGRCGSGDRYGVRCGRPDAPGRPTDAGAAGRGVGGARRSR